MTIKQYAKIILLNTDDQNLLFDAINPDIILKLIFILIKIKMNNQPSDKIKQFIRQIKNHIEQTNISLDVLLLNLKLDNSAALNQETLIKIIDTTNMEKSMFNPFKMNDEFKRCGCCNVQQLKSLYSLQLTSSSVNASPSKQDPKVDNKQVKKIEEKPAQPLKQQIVSIKSIHVDKIEKIEKKIPENPQIKPKNPIPSPLEQPNKPAKKAVQSVFQDQTPEYVINQIKNLFASDSRALPNLLKQCSLENTIFIKRPQLKKILLNIKIQCLRNEALVESLINIILKKERMSKYEFQVFFDEYGKSKKSSAPQPLKIISDVAKKPQEIKKPNEIKKNDEIKPDVIKKQTINQSPKKQVRIEKQTRKNVGSGEQKKIQQLPKFASIAISTEPEHSPQTIKKDQPKIKYQIDCQTIKPSFPQKQQSSMPQKQQIKKKQTKASLQKVDSVKQMNLNKTITTNNREAPSSRVEKRKGQQGMRKMFSSQEKSTVLLVRNKLQSKKQIQEEPKNKFLLASHYFRLNSHSTQEEKNCVIKLEELLKVKKQFIDASNPLLKLKGQVYTPINNIFAEKQYVVVSKSATQPITKDVIGSKHVIQGQLGNCYFVSVLASIAAIHPKKISELILFQANPSNYLAVRLFINGEWRIIETDNRFACEDGRVCYSKSFKNQIWAMLIEKAFAKVYGSYLEIESGSPTQSFFILTGAPCEHYNYKDDKVEVGEVVKILKAHLAEGYLMGTSISKLQNETEESLKKKGLIVDHAYSLLDIFEIHYKIYVKMRNPWSNEVIWKGDWKEVSKSFSNQTKAKLNNDIQQKDGIFFMEWKYFYRYFNSVSICMINPEYYHTSLKLNFNKKKSNYVKLTIDKEGTYNIFICQQFERKYKKTNPNFEASDSRLIIMKRDETGQLSYISSKSKTKSQVCCENVYLQAGVYIVSAKIVWKQWINYQACLVSYGVGKAALELISNRKMVPAFKTSLIQGFIANNKKNQQSHVCLKGENGPVTEYRYFCVNQGIGYMRVVNSSTQTYKLKYTFKLTGMKVIKPRGNTVIMELKPMDQQKVGVFITPNGCLFDYSIAIV